jgi:hypothetical protein
MKKNIAFFLFSIFFISSPFLSKSGCICGGNFEWTCIGQDSFIITLTLYRDCNGCNFNTVTIPIKCVTTGLTITTLNIAQPTGLDITPTCETSCTRCQTSACSFPYGHEKYTYTTLLDLSNAGNCCKIEMSYQTCCRELTIRTGAEGKIFYLDATLDRCLSPCDNSPKFKNNPFRLLCIGQDAVLNLGITDYDSNNQGNMDSISFEWTPPLQGKNNPITYSGQYSYDKPIYFWGFPATNRTFPYGLHLDNQTGDIRFRPMKIEQTVMCIKVKKWRKINGSMTNISEQTHDIHTIVLSCPNNNSPVLSGPYYKEVCVGNTVSFSIPTNDYDTDDTLRIWYDSSITGASWSSNNDSVKHPTGVFSWTPGSEDTSPYPHTFTVTVKDDACPLNGRATRAYQILVKANPKADFSVADSGCGNYHFHAQKTVGYNPVYIWNADFFPNNQAFGDRVSAQIHGKGSFPYSLVVSENGCSTLYFDNIHSSDSFLYSTTTDTVKACFGDSISLTASYFNNKGNVHLTWNTGDTTETIRYFVTKDEFVQAEITDSAGCVVDYRVFIDMQELPLVDLGGDRHLCSYSSETILVNYTLFDFGLKQISWYDQKDSLISTNNLITLYDSGWWYCQVEDSLGCVGTDTIKLFVNPEVRAYTSGNVICQGDTSFHSAISTGSQTASVLYSWYNKTTNELMGQSQSVFLTPDTTTDYKLLVTEVLNGIECRDSIDFRIRVNPKPAIQWNSIPERCLNGSIISLNDYVTVDTQSSKTWSSPSDGLLSAYPGDKFHPLIAGAGQHKVFIDIENTVTGCRNSDSNLVNIHALPTPFAGKDTDICFTTVHYDLEGQPAYPAGYWRSIEGIGVAGNIFNTQDHGIEYGQYYHCIYHYTDSNSCENEDTMRISVNQINAAFSSDLTYGISPLAVQFTDESDGQNLRITHWEWINQRTNETSILQNPSFTLTDTGNHNIRLYAYDDYGCGDSVWETIRVTPTIGMEENETDDISIFPNPASDQLIIRSKNAEVKIYSISLYNSIGQKLRDYQKLDKKEFMIYNNHDLLGTYFMRIGLSNGEYYLSKIVFE